MNYNDGQYESLSIATFGSSTLPKETKQIYERKITNYIDDIDGAKAINKYEKFYNKTLPNLNEYSYSKSNSLSQQNRQIRDIMKIDDIDGTRQKVMTGIAVTKRHVNPLEPNYDLPKFIERINTPPKFLRDTLNISDIAGTSTKPQHIYQTRNFYDPDDIEGTKSKIKNNYPTRDIMHQDNIIEKKDKHFHHRTQRQVNTLQPTYQIFGKQISDDPRYTKPKPNKQFIPENAQLQTRDIDGAYPGWVNEDIYIYKTRNITNTNDIEGAQADTLKRHLYTTRITNPTQPLYQALDGDGYLPSVNNSLLPIELFQQAHLTPTLHVNHHTHNNSNNPESVTPPPVHISLRDDPIGFGNSLPAFDHHPSIPDDDDKISLFNVYDKKYHRDAGNNTSNNSNTNTMNNSHNKVKTGTTSATTATANNNNNNSTTTTSTVNPDTATTAAAANSGNTINNTNETAPASSSSFSFQDKPTPQPQPMSKQQQQLQQQSKPGKPSSSSSSTPHYADIAGTPANHSIMFPNTLELMTKRILNENAITSPPILKNYVRSKTNTHSNDRSGDYNNVTSSSSVTFKQRKAIAERQSEIAAVRSLQFIDPSPPVVDVPVPVAAETGKGGKAAGGAANKDGGKKAAAAATTAAVAGDKKKK